jgi:hypothetical protein
MRPALLVFHPLSMNTYSKTVHTNCLPKITADFNSKGGGTMRIMVRTRTCYQQTRYNALPQSSPVWPPSGMCGCLLTVTGYRLSKTGMHLMSCVVQWLIWSVRYSHNFTLHYVNQFRGLTPFLRTCATAKAKYTLNRTQRAHERHYSELKHKPSEQNLVDLMKCEFVRVMTGLDRRMGRNILMAEMKC